MLIESVQTTLFNAYGGAFALPITKKETA